MPKRARLLDLDVDRVLKPLRIEIMMIGGGGAAGQHELGQREPRGQPEVVGLEPRPDRIERDEPGEQRLVDGGRVGAGQRLVEMMVGVDEPRQHDMAGGVERRVDALRASRPAPRSCDPRALDDEAAFRALGEDRQRVLDPCAQRSPCPLRRRFPIGNGLRLMSTAGAASRSAHIGGLTPFVPTATKPAASAPLSPFWAGTKTVAPGLRSASVAGPNVTIGMPSGIEIVFSLPPL